jgi:Tol biopolymer transport system component
MMHQGTLERQLASMVSSIVFSKDVADNQNISVMNADGTNVQRITDYEGLDTSPVWRP